MPDVPAQPESILAESARRASVLTDRLDVLMHDLSHSEPVLSLSPADRSEGLTKLEAAVTALREVARLCDTTDPSCPDASPQQPPTP